MNKNPLLVFDWSVQLYWKCWIQIDKYDWNKNENKRTPIGCHVRPMNWTNSQSMWKIDTKKVKQFHWILSFAYQFHLNHCQIRICSVLFCMIWHAFRFTFDSSCNQSALFSFNWTKTVKKIRTACHHIDAGNGLSFCWLFHVESHQN